MEARIIKLGDNTRISSVLSFDEGLEEFSYAKGNRKARRAEKKEERKQKKLKKIADKSEIKAAKQGARATKKVGRIGVREQAQQARQGKRTNKAVAKQTRKTTRKTMRMERQEMGNEAMPDELEEDILDQNDDSQPSYSDDQQYDESGSEDTGAGYDEGTIEDNPDASYEDEPYEEEESYDEEFEQDGGDVYNEFDGVSAEEDPSGEFTDGNDEVDVPQGVQIVADKIEWNKEYIVRLNDKKGKIIIQDPEADVDEYDTLILEKQHRLGLLGKVIDAFINFDGDFDDQNEFSFFNDEDSSDAAGKRAKAQVGKPKRLKQVAKARGNAKAKREKVTIVKTTLNPIFEKQSIRVPATSSMIGPEASPDKRSVGLIGLDDKNDFDAPSQLDIELGSNFSGLTTKNINWAGIAVGAGLACGLVWVINKYKLIK